MKSQPRQKVAKAEKWIARVAALAMVLLLYGCSPGNQANPSASPSASPSATGPMHHMGGSDEGEPGGRGGHFMGGTGEGAFFPRAQPTASAKPETE